MRPAELKEWRKKLALTQEEAARRFDVSRVTIQNWENGTNPIPSVLGAACESELQRWRRRPDYGPVILDYGDFTHGSRHSVGGHVGQKVQEKFATNEAALRRATDLCGGPAFEGALIVDEHGNIVWDLLGLRAEIDRRFAVKKNAGEKANLIAIMNEIADHCSSLPVLDTRTDDEILGYDERGLPS